jgi:hypothetical protein
MSAWRTANMLLRRQHVTYLPLAMNGIGPAFIKHAVLSSTLHTPEHVLAPLLGRLFRAVLRSGRVPAAWNVARPTPQFTKGDRSDPSNNHLIAVSPVVYRL